MCVSVGTDDPVTTQLHLLTLTSNTRSIFCPLADCSLAAGLTSSFPTVLLPDSISPSLKPVPGDINLSTQ